MTIKVIRQTKPVSRQTTRVIQLAKLVCRLAGLVIQQTTRVSGQTKLVIQMTGGIIRQTNSVSRQTILASRMTAAARWMTGLGLCQAGLRFPLQPLPWRCLRRGSQTMGKPRAAPTMRLLPTNTILRPTRLWRALESVLGPACRADGWLAKGGRDQPIPRRHRQHRRRRARPRGRHAGLPIPRPPKARPENPALLAAWHIGHRLVGNRANLEQFAEDFLTRSTTDVLPGITAADKTRLTDALTAWKSAIKRQAAAGQAQRATVREQLESILECRLQIQFAADAIWPHHDPKNVEIREAFSLALHRPFDG